MENINYVWAEDLDGNIGKNGTLPWHVKADMQHFKQVTMNHPVIMGRTTYDSIGRPLPHRENIVLSHRPIADQQVTTLTSLRALQDWLAASQAPEIDVIGGAQLFAALLPQATTFYKTVINGHYDGDTKMPPINYDQWHLVDRQTVSEDGQPVCWFETWRLNVK